MSRREQLEHEVDLAGKRLDELPPDAPEEVRQQMRLEYDDLSFDLNNLYDDSDFDLTTPIDE
ncbi:MAG: hypothetical protein LIP08_04210 [Bacteroides sp.]|nr:hypothetical protein [Bacteroides sp.]